MSLKQCRVCEVEKVSSEYYKDGRDTTCKVCRRNQMREQYKKRRAGTPAFKPRATTEKRCSECGEVKPAEEFGKRSRNNEFLRSKCKPCHNRLKRERRTNDPHARDKEREYEARTREQDRRRRAKRLYDLQPVEYDALLEKQDGKCAICHKRPRKYFHVDHCHETGKVRGLLCPPCNVAIAQLGDSVEGLQRAIDYLS